MAASHSCPARAWVLRKKREKGQRKPCTPPFIFWWRRQVTQRPLCFEAKSMLPSAVWLVPWAVEGNTRAL
eukprot:12651282-Prorocentrum_lima.AAC.1